MPARALILLPLAILLSGAAVRAQAPAVNEDERVALHHSAEWLMIVPHLPDPEKATAADLEMAGDVLRARRFPEDALDYYGYAMARGGKVGTLLNKMGVTRLELGQYDLAKQMFLRVVRADKKNSQAWNNLGAVEFVNKKYGAAIEDYRKATSLKKTSGVYRANLGLAYFETGHFEDAHEQFVIAMRLDPGVMTTRDDGGVAARILAQNDYPRLCFEMAKLYAMREQAADVRLWLAKANEAGLDLADGLRGDRLLAAYLKDPEVRLMLANSAQMRKKNVASAKNLPSLGAASGDRKLF
jgi:Tfp pilus assembly protein PilF